LSDADINEIGIQLCRALDHAHKRGVVHRDIKPGNIMREAASGNFILLDAGLAFDIVGESLSAGFPVGTMPYFSPEQFDYSNRRILDFRSDMFSLGTTLYEAATRRHPFWAPGDSAAVLYSRITKAAPTRPRDLNQEIPEGLERVILRMLGKSPHLRYRKCAQLISDLREALGT